MAHTSFICAALLLAGVYLAGKFKIVYSDTKDVCLVEEFTVSCDPDEVIVVESAYYGRMTQGRCIVEDEFIGCRNNVLSLLDQWCSGKHQCTVEVPNDDLEKANTNCKRYLKSYLTVDYNCQKVRNVCGSSSTQAGLSSSQGYISSLQRDTKGCGSLRSPWIISASQGQIIQLDLIDFAASSFSSNLVTCPLVYGFILERVLGINETFCGGRSRQRLLYTSKTNSLHIYIASKQQRADKHFLISYKVTGCPELRRPAHAWYKREGNQAVIGCETNDQEWRLTCNGNKWIGEIGNCSQSVALPQPEVKKTMNADASSSAVVMTGIAGAAVVLCVIVIVIGTVYTKKYRMHQETKHLMKTYATLEKDTLAYYRPPTLDQSARSEAGWDSTLPLDSRDQCTCSRMPLSNYPDGSKIAVGGSSLERQSLYSSIKST